MRLARMLDELSGGEKSFAIYDAAHQFIVGDDFASFLQADLGRPPTKEDRDLAHDFLGAVYTPNHHNLYWEGYHEAIADADQRVADFVRTAMWTFLMAWNHRFGGIDGHLVKRGSLVDPSLRDGPPA